MEISFLEAKMGKLYIYTKYIYSISYKLENYRIYPMVILWLCCGYHLMRYRIWINIGYYMDAKRMECEVMSGQQALNYTASEEARELRQKF